VGSSPHHYSRPLTRVLICLRRPHGNQRASGRSFGHRELCPVHRSFIAMSGTANGRIIAESLTDRGGLLDMGSTVKVSCCRYQPIMIILYASRMTTVSTAIQADSV